VRHGDAMTRALLRLIGVTTATCVALLLGAAPAFAHTRLEGSDPTDGSSIAGGPASVSLRFSESVSAQFTSLTVVGPDGAEYQTGGVSAANGEVSTAVSPLGPAGAYQIGYRVVSDDGHPVQGKVSFTLTSPGPGTGKPAPAAAPGPLTAPVTPAVDPQAGSRQGEDAPIWPWLAGAVVLVGAGAAVALRLGKGGR
jgi:methionine-rich copper-binding protein CopC